MRTKCDFSSASRTNYNNFCKLHPEIKLSYNEWRVIIYSFMEMFKEHILETGEKGRFPSGFGEFSIRKKKRKKIVIDSNGKEQINLPIDWVKSKQKGKKVYNFNYHTEGYFFGWVWFKKSTRIKNVKLWYFKASRTTSRLLAHYLKVDNKYQHIYREWEI